MDEIPFSKLQGLGNDFVVIDNLHIGLSLSPEQVRHICDNHFGVSADGVILVEQSHVADFKMVFYNPDGTLAQMCGNGIRCMGKFLRDKKLATGSRIRIETGAGIRMLSIIDTPDETFTATVDMGRPGFECRAIPVAHPGKELVDEMIEVLPGEFVGATCVSMGNPHTVFFVDDVYEAPVVAWGQALQSSELFPEKTNVEFVQVLDNKTIKIRVWERGAGETLACGTGACAAAVAAARLGRTGREVDVHLLGGVLRVLWSESGLVYMTGAAETVFEGLITL